MKRNLYLNTISFDEAYNLYMNTLNEKNILMPTKEVINIYDSLNRITSSPIYAKANYPLYNLSSMDGICVKSKELINISENNPKIIELNMDYKIVDTGDPIIEPYDAVIMAEDLIYIDDNHVKIISSPTAWQNVRHIGEDITIGEMIIEKNHIMTPFDIAACISTCNLDIECYKKVKVGIIPTGDEIIEPNVEPKIGDIIDSNSGMLASLVEKENAIPKKYDIVKDDYDKIKENVLLALKENDVVLINAGSSCGTEDYTVHILKELGNVVVHGISIKPGKPAILAIVNNKAVIGCPGYPVSSYIVFENFVKKIIRILSGNFYDEKYDKLECRVSKRIISSLKFQEFIRVKIGKVNNEYVAAPLSRNASSIMSMVKADGYIVIEKGSEGIEAGEKCDVIITNKTRNFDNALISIGSHDIINDVIDDIMIEKYNVSFSSTHVGSMSGLMALKRNETIIAPIHILDEKSGRYNVDVIKKMFGSGEISIIKGFNRIQGIYVKKGNPLNIKNIKDIVGKRFVNRQKGAGTRVLFDYLLKKNNIDINEIYGYDKEVMTHMAVAVSILSDNADVGMGIMSVANNMGLDFIEIGVEEYDYAIHTKDLENKNVKHFIDIIKSNELKDRISKIGGYGFDKTGDIIIV